MDFQIDLKNIDGSFDLIAKQLLLSRAIQINNQIVEITEIEFYFFKEGSHADKYTHPHERNAGEWRLHNQGIDITLQGTKDQDGGILIRGIKLGSEFINGPLKSLSRIFELMGSASFRATIELVKTSVKEKEIIKTFRHLPNKIQYSEFHESKYRYLIDLDNLKIEQQIKDRIQANHVKL